MLLAVHISDGLLDWPLLLDGWGIAGVLLLVACWRFRDDEVPRIGVFTAALFVASLIHVKTGPTTVHLLLNGIAGIVLGRRAPLAAVVAVALQYLMLAHGGLGTIGVNATVSAGPALLAGVLFRLLYDRCKFPAFVAGAIVGGFTVVLTVALSATVLWLGSGTASDWLAGLQIVLHVPVLVVETIGSGLVAGYLAKVKPEWLAGGLVPADTSESVGLVLGSGSPVSEAERGVGGVRSNLPPAEGSTSPPPTPLRSGEGEPSLAVTPLPASPQQTAPPTGPAPG